MPVMVLGLVFTTALVILFTTALVILAIVLMSQHRRRRVARDEGGAYAGDGGWNPALFSGDSGSSDCGAGDAGGGGGCDGGGGGGGD